MEKGRNCSPGAISPLFHNICILLLDFYVKTRTRFSLRDKRLFGITEVEITRVDCTLLRKGALINMKIDPHSAEFARKKIYQTNRLLCKLRGLIRLFADTHTQSIFQSPDEVVKKSHAFFMQK